jgi:hypothetical protein
MQAREALAQARAEVRAASTFGRISRLAEQRGDQGGSDTAFLLSCLHHLRARRWVDIARAGVHKGSS